MRHLGRAFIVGVLLIGMLSVGGSSPATAAKAPTAKALLGKQFKSFSVKGNPKLKGKTLRLRFFMHSSEAGQPKKPTMVLSGGCNSLGSGFKSRGGRLTSRGPFAGTAMGCSVNPDRWLTSKFRKGLKARTIGKRLVLTRPAEGVRFAFRQIGKTNSAPDKKAPDYQVPIGDPATVEDLEGKSFESVKVIGKQVEKPIKLSFHGKLGAYLGCNHMGGDYEFRHGKLRWLNVITTEMACQDSNDGWFSGLLDQGVEATVKDSWLVLTRGETVIVLKKVAEAAFPEKVPAGVPSTVESLNGRNFESISVVGRHVKAPIEISFWTGKLNRFDDAGKQVVGTGMGAYLGCNWMGGEYEIEDGQLIWLDVVSTLIGCFNDGNDRDAWFTELLNQGVEASESEAGLIFDRGPTQIVFKEVP